MKKLVLSVAILLLVASATIAQERTTTGFYYPTGVSSIPPTCGPWLGRDRANGGCYSDGWYHIGWDIMAPLNSNVYAVADGDIFHISPNGWTSGTTTNIGVFVRHRLANGNYFLALYGHVLPTGTILGQAKTLAVGDHVSAGQAFAKVGDWSGGDHVHFGVVPTTTLPPVITNIRGFGRMNDSEWDDPNTFVDPIAFIRNNSPYSSTPQTGDFSMSATPITTTVTIGQTASFFVILTSRQTYPVTVSLEAFGLPYGFNTTTTRWMTNPVVAPTSGAVYAELRVGTNASTALGTKTITLRATSGGITRSTLVQLTVNPLVQPTISSIGFISTPYANTSFGGYVNGTGFVIGATRVFFCSVTTGSCYEQPPAGISVASSTRLSFSNARLGAGTWQIYVRTSGGASARSASFSVVNPPPTISSFSWSSTPYANTSFGGYVYGTGFVSNGTSVYFCSVATGACYQHPSAGVYVSSATRLSISGVRLSAGYWRVQVRTSAGSSAKSSSFRVY